MNSSPSFGEMLDKPEFLADPVFPRKRFLNALCGGKFRKALTRLGRPELIPKIGVTSETEQMTMLTAGSFAAWTFDFDAVLKDGRTGRQHFIERAEHDVRRPPTELAAITCTQHIISKGVVKLQVQSETPTTGEHQFCVLKTIGWYVAELKNPI